MTVAGAPAYDFSIDPNIAPLKEDQVKILRASLSELIARRIEGIHYADARRSQLATIGGALAPIGVALVPLAVGTDIFWLRIMLLTVAITLVLLGLAVWWLYMHQINYKYPWVGSVEQNWKWFYHGALKDKAAFGPNRWGIKHSRCGRQNEERETASQWTAFAQQATGLSDEKVNATQDLKQLYELHINERYKNLFLTHLRRLLSAGLVTTVIFALIAAALSAKYGPPHPDSSVMVAKGVEFKARWSPTGAVRANGLSSHDIEYRLELTVSNGSGHDVTFTRFVASDESEKPLPVEFFSVPALPFHVDNGKDISFIGHFWVSASDTSDIQEISAQ